MNKFKLLPSLLISAVVLQTACSSTNTEVGTVAAGGAMGATAGAATGALVGTLISRGDVAASALLGAGIGLPVGLALGYAWQKQAEEAEEAVKLEQYIRNQESIKQREREIEALRNEVLLDSPTETPSFDSRQHLFEGASLGNPNL